MTAQHQVTQVHRHADITHGVAAHIALVQSLVYLLEVFLTAPLMLTAVRRVGS